MVSSPFDVWDRRHQTDRGHQQPAVGMRSETDQQHVCHQASVGRFGVTSTQPAAAREQDNSMSVLKEARHTNQAREEGKQRSQAPITSMDPAGDEHSCVCLVYG